MKKEAIFKSKTGQIDFSKARWCPVINCVLVHNSTFLVVQRNAGMRLYPGYWNGISGFLDDHQSLEEKARAEIQEETGITGADIVSIKRGAIFDQEAPELKRTWIVHPLLVKVRTKNITLDWEAQQHRWVTAAEAKKLKLMPGFSEVIKATIGAKKR